MYMRWVLIINKIWDAPRFEEKKNLTTSMGLDSKPRVRGTTAFASSLPKPLSYTSTIYVCLHRN